MFPLQPTNRCHWSATLSKLTGLTRRQTCNVFVLRLPTLWQAHSHSDACLEPMWPDVDLVFKQNCVSV
jgi:hypothetical protein